jgi:hypothetical protein
LLAQGGAYSHLYKLGFSNDDDKGQSSTMS